MIFPVWIPVGSWRIHPHLFFELLAYAVAAAVYWRRRRGRGDHVSAEARWALVSAAVVGALVGSRMLFWFEDPQRTVSELSSLQYLMGGQTIVGGLLGGWIAVEWQKHRLNIIQPTGDLFAIPIAMGGAVGRIGCFLSGLPDGTYGLASSLPWAIDLGDGIPRHPTAIYEAAFMFAVAWFLTRLERGARRGDLFLTLIAAYLMFRFTVDFVKPGVTVIGGLTAIQLVCLIALAVTGRLWRQRRQIAAAAAAA